MRLEITKIAAQRANLSDADLNCSCQKGVVIQKVNSSHNANY